MTYIVLDIGTSKADVPAILKAMDGDGLEIVGVDGSHVGARIVGFLYEVNAPSPFKRYRIESLGPSGTDMPAEPASRPLEWHKGTHVWEEHDGYPRHQHSINGVLTIAPNDTGLHFAGGKPFTGRTS